jgi:nucleoside-diphosphate-sugar epimerase
MAGSAFQEDIERIITAPEIPWRDMTGATVFVTGATGLIGGALLRVLAAANKRHGLRLRMIGHGRNAARGETLRRECGIAFVAGDIRKPIPAEALPKQIDYIFHCAAITRSADMTARPVDVIETAVDGARNLLVLAKERRCGSFVYLSSMEVYGQTECVQARETDLGYIDLRDPRSSYPQSKRLCESLCVAYAAQYGVPAKIARLARTFGAGVQKDDADTRVAMQFARKAISGEDIVLHTAGHSVANCCDTADAIMGLLTILLKGADGAAYNVANSEASATVREMAAIVAERVCGGAIRVVVDVPKDIAARGYAPDVGYTLNADKLKAMGWTPRYGLADMYRRMIADWRETQP